MKANGSQPAMVGLFRLDRFALEIAVATNELGKTLPIVRIVVGQEAPGPWVPAHMFTLLAKAAEAADELNASGVFVAQPQARPNGPRLLDALGGDLPESAP